MAQNFPNLGKETDIQIKGFQRIPQKEESEQTHTETHTDN